MELKTKQEEVKSVKADLQYFQEEKEAAYKQSQVLRWDPKKKLEMLYFLHRYCL